MRLSSARPRSARARVVAPLLALALGACGGAPPVVVAAADAARGIRGGDVAADTAPPTAADLQAVARLVRDYLRVRPARLAPNPYWRRDEQERFSNFDVAGMWTYGTPAFRERYGAYTVEVEPAPSGAESGTVEATVRFAPRDPATTRPASVRLFARREDGRWRLGTALLQVIRRWPESRVGPIAFRTQPGLALDSARAAGAARYVDSLAAVFDVEPPRDILYVLARSSDEALLAMGVSDPALRLGGLHFRRNRLIISGGGWRDPYMWHELAHAVFHNVPGQRTRHRFVSEGAAEWMEWRMQPRGEWTGRWVVRNAIARRPRLGLRDVARAGAADGEVAFYPSAAWLVGRVHAAAGVRGVRELLATAGPSDEVLSVARRHLRLSQPQLDSAWRAWARGAGTTYGP